MIPFDSSRLFSILGEVHYGTQDFTVQPFTFLSGEPPGAFAPINFAAIDFSPLSIAFENPSPGVLRYTGPPRAKVRVSYSTTFQWVSGSPTGAMLFAVVVFLNDSPIAQTTDITGLEIGGGPTSFSSFEGQGLLELSPNDELLLRIIALNVFDPTQAQQNTVNFLNLSLIAHRV